MTIERTYVNKPKLEWIPIFSILLFIVEQYFHINIGLPIWFVLYIILGGYLFFRYKESPAYSKHALFYKPVMLYVAVLISSFVMVYINSVMPIYYALKSYSIVLLGVLMYFPLNAIRKKYGFIVFNNTIVLVSIVISVIMLLQSFGYISIIDNVGEREGRMRTFVGMDLVTIASFIILTRMKFSFRRNNIKYIIIMFLFVSYLYLVCQSRSQLMAGSIGIGVLLLIRMRNSMVRNKRVQFLAYLIIISFFIIGIYYAYQITFNTVKQSMEINEASSIKRLEAYIYYFNEFIKRPILGVGLTIGDVNVLVADGVMQKLFVDDIGIVGFIAEFGIVGILVIFLVYKRIVKILLINPNPFLTALTFWSIAYFPFNFRWAQDNGSFYMALLMVLCESFRYERSIKI